MQWILIVVMSVLTTTAGCRPAIAPAPNPNAIQIPLGCYVLLQLGDDTVALVLTQHTTTADGETKYQWYHQDDGTADFTKSNVITGAGEVFERYARTSTSLTNHKVQDVGGQLNIKCGPTSIEWSQGDWLYISPGQRVAVTSWTQVKEIDVEDTRLMWKEFQ